jgi:hypothetical protein
MSRLSRGVSDNVKLPTGGQVFDMGTAGGGLWHGDVGRMTLLSLYTEATLVTLPQGAPSLAARPASNQPWTVPKLRCLCLSLIVRVDFAQTYADIQHYVRGIKLLARHTTPQTPSPKPLQSPATPPLTGAS